MTGKNIAHYNTRNDTTEAVSLSPSLCDGIVDKYCRELIERSANNQPKMSGLEPRTTSKKFIKRVVQLKAMYDLVHEYKDNEANYHNYCFVAPYDKTKVKIVNYSLMNKKLIGDHYIIVLSKHAIARMMYRLATTEIRKVIGKLSDAIQRYYNLNYIAVNKPLVDGEVNIPVHMMGDIICETMGDFCIAKTFITQGQMSQQQLIEHAEKMVYLAEHDPFIRSEQERLRGKV